VYPAASQHRYYTSADDNAACRRSAIEHVRQLCDGRHCSYSRASGACSMSAAFDGFSFACIYVCDMSGKIRCRPCQSDSK
jgi:hypothetical protein